jgi:hypothetical protein
VGFLLVYAPAARAAAAAVNAVGRRVAAGGAGPTRGSGGAAAAADGPLGFSAGLHYQLHIILVTYWAAECRWAGWLSVTGGYSEDVSTD